MRFVGVETALFDYSTVINSILADTIALQVGVATASYELTE